MVGDVVERLAVRQLGVGVAREDSIGEQAAADALPRGLARPRGPLSAGPEAEVLALEPVSRVKSPRKRKPVGWRSLPPAELAAHLITTPTIADSAWTTEPRLPRENREPFIRRIVLGETPESGTEEAPA